MKKNILIALLLCVVSGLHITHAQTTTSTTNQAEVSAGITPDSMFYFLDKFAEKIQEFFAFTSAQKIALNIELAKERFAEYKLIKDKPGVDPQTVLTTKTEIKNHVHDVLDEASSNEATDTETVEVKNNAYNDIISLDRDINDIDHDNDSDTASSSDEKTNEDHNTSTGRDEKAIDKEDSNSENSFLGDEVDKTNELMVNDSLDLMDDEENIRSTTTVDLKLGGEGHDANEGKDNNDGHGDGESGDNENGD